MPINPRDLNRFAILLDVDGTLLDIAPTPREVIVPPDLPQTLARVRDRARRKGRGMSGRPPAAPGEGSALLAAARAQGLAGVVARRLDGGYEPGSLRFVPA